MNRNKFKVQASSGRISDGGLGFGLPLPLNALELDPSAKRSRLSYVQEPIDFSVITEPSVIVLLRNLQKKESVTKAKALEDLLRLTEASPAWLGEESFLSAWVGQYVV